MSLGPNQKSSIDQSVSFEDVSKLFSLPLSEAADILGVSSSVLKKLCNENGLQRWPHRQFLAGKSIEEIKKEAAELKSKAVGGISPKSDVTTTSSTTTSPGSHIKDKSPRSALEMSKSQGSTQEPGSKTTITWRTHHVLASGLASETNTFSDEFKYGFPSGGLSECTNRWWGNSFDGDDTKTSSKVEDASEVQADDGISSMCEEKTNNATRESECHKQDEVSECNKHDEVSECGKQNEVSLSAVRKRALEEGKKALKFRALKKYGADKLGNEEKILLRRLYQTS